MNYELPSEEIYNDIVQKIINHEYDIITDLTNLNIIGKDRDINVGTENPEFSEWKRANMNSIIETTKYNMDNYLEIQKKMEQNDLPTKKSMIRQISNIIKLENSKL